MFSTQQIPNQSQASFMNGGTFWLLVALILAGFFFAPGINTLLEAWQLPEYSHGPLIPILSGLLFLRQLKEWPERPGPIGDRWAGVFVIAVSVAFAALGHLSGIHDLVAYALIIWIAGMLLLSFGWKTGKHFWPPVVHLVYMLPLPGVIYYKMTTNLQFISSELGVWFLKLIHVPVFLDGNVIDLGVTKLLVAEACSGLRYMFPIMSFSYIFAVLYRGQKWHKAVLLLAAVPITIVMNSVRIAIAGYIVNNYGLEWVEGFSHFFEGWVIFGACILILFGLARIMLYFNPVKMSLVEALDLDTDGLWTQFRRIRLVQPSAALMAGTAILLASTIFLYNMSDRNALAIPRDNFAVFPRTLGDWVQSGEPSLLTSDVERVLGADDYHQVNFVSPTAVAPVGLFMAWYSDQSKGGVHSPEICLPGSGWEIAWLERTDISAQIGVDDPFNVNRAIIQKGESKMMVYYWFEQKGRRIAWDFSAKFWLMADGITTGRTDGALVRLTTVILPDETDGQAEARLLEMTRNVVDPLPRFIPDA